MAPADDPRPYYRDDLCPECRTKMDAMMDWFCRKAQRDSERRDVLPPVVEEPTTTPEDTLREAWISNRRQASYQRRMSSLLARRS